MSYVRLFNSKTYINSIKIIDLQPTHDTQYIKIEFKNKKKLIIIPIDKNLEKIYEDTDCIVYN